MNRCEGNTGEVAFHLKVNGLSAGSHGSLLEGLREGRVGVASASNILRAGTVLHGQDTLGNHLTGVRAHDVDTQNAVGLLVRDHLDHTLGISVGAGTGVGGEGEGTNVVGDARLLDLLLRLAAPGDLGVGVDNGGDDVVVDVAVTAVHVLNSSDTLLLGLVGQHGTVGDITNAANVGDGGAELRVDGDATALVDLDANVLETETLSVGLATNGDEDNIGIQLIKFNK